MVTQTHEGSPAVVPWLPVLNPVSPPRQPPLTPTGWQVGPPDFVGVGAMKSGTTWWWSILTSHPDIASRRADASENAPANAGAENLSLYGAKEIHFFDHYGRVEQIDPASYHRYFPRPEGCLVGEWTPRYMYDFWTPPMLRTAAPSAKLLVLLRDPLERFVSGLGHHAKFGAELTGPVMEHQFHRGFYWQQIQNLLNYFERDQILVLQYEQCMRDTLREATRTFAFLGVDPHRWEPAGDYTQRVGMVSAKPTVDQATLRAVRRAIEPDITRLLREFPDIDATLWPSMNQSP